MANSKYEYVKREFEFHRHLPASNWIVVLIDGCHFHRFSELHAFEKPNDERALRLMNACATSMLEKFPDIVFAYGVSDEYSFVFREKTEFHKRRESKIISLCVSYFTSVYGMQWKDFFPNDFKETPYFDGRVVCYPNIKTIRDYLAWRQVDCHINNQYNTCFWALVKSGKTEKEAHQALKGTFSKDKNKLLLQQFQVNYNDEPAVFRKGSSVYRDKVKTDDCGNPIKRTREAITVSSFDLIGPEFWENHQYILGEASDYLCLGGKEKYGYEYVKKFDDIHRLPYSNWTIVRISACQFDQFSLIHSFDKPNDETALRLMNACASLMMEQFPDIIFGYGFDNEYSFVFQEKTELYQRDEKLIISSCISCFTSFYMMRWKEYFPGKELVQSPHFQVEVFCYPEPRIVCDYLSWRQSECHNRNQYTTCFWMLVKSGEGENKAKEILKDTLPKDKNELLFQRFQMNYNNEPAMFRKGSCAYRQKVEASEDERWDVAVAHVDMGPHFWAKHSYVFDRR
ncbi:tRNA(His) guanylyltransferase 2-like isoform X1 [Triticum dicoccoides]|uniref:tRNA(His) guanylyltransferase 2-like isoform X1 n=1 Tax=Triticum dicoccoides TaxID=85692 RepID=UPI000E79DDF2|nr:tRNA(His) guanylyltransferase 2-like isoform X1 [Triticum dicoccoides]XP_037432492.1 tRNA(His) guanylyltransferase 2-like isoform X1 [Triticum dicoccoides]